MLRIDGVFVQLAPYAEVLEPALAMAGAGKLPGRYDARELARLFGISGSRLPIVIAALQAAESLGVVNRDRHGLWAVTLPKDLCAEVALLMRGARLYRDRVQSDANQVEVVVSRPAAPSRLVAKLERTVEGLWGFEETAVMLGQMAAGATRRFSVMTPFVDEDGAERILSLFQATRPGVSKELVVRDGLPAALGRRAGELKALSVNVYDFRIPKPDKPENETFHAKVVRVDTSECYAGSSNMTKWSFEYSLELGFHVRGPAAVRVAQLLDAVMAVSARVPL
jgi:hypothetical protein